MKLNSLVMLNVISTAQANTIHRSLRTILDIQLKRTQGQPQELPQEALADLCRSDPQILNLLEPFLPDELVERLMEEFKDDARDPRHKAPDHWPQQRRRRRALAAMRLWHTAALPSQVVTFAAPHAGNPAFADLYGNADILHTRYEFQDDIVPHVPPTIGGVLAQLESVPWIGNLLPGLLQFDYEPLGELRFIDWSNEIVGDSKPLQLHRLGLKATLQTKPGHSG
jgi:hypothetical protein